MIIPLSELKKAVSILNAGGLVAFPTETVYGLGADASNALAIRRIFEAKERPFDHPLIVHLADFHQLTDWAQTIPDTAIKLAKAFWPGPLTLILKKKPQVLDSVTAGQDTIGLRIPAHPVAQALLQAFGRGLAAPSANKFTHVSPTTAQAVNEELGSAVDLILDGGACRVGLESTIIDLSSDQPILLRPGMITVTELEEKLGLAISIPNVKETTVRVPGRHHLHYAPTTKTTLIKSENIASLFTSLKTEDYPIALLAYHEMNIQLENKIHYVKMPKDAAGYAHQLYQTLRSLDRLHFKRIVIEMVPEDQEWAAINDRLKKASGSQT